MLIWNRLTFKKRFLYALNDLRHAWYNGLSVYINGMFKIDKQTIHADNTYVHKYTLTTLNKDRAIQLKLQLTQIPIFLNLFFFLSFIFCINVSRYLLIMSFVWKPYLKIFIPFFPLKFVFIYKGWQLFILSKFKKN